MVHLFERAPFDRSPFELASFGAFILAPGLPQPALYSLCCLSLLVGHLAARVPVPGVSTPFYKYHLAARVTSGPRPSLRCEHLYDSIGIHKH